MEIDLQFIADELDVLPEGMTAYLNRETGEVALITDQIAAIVEESLDPVESGEDPELILEAQAVQDGLGTVYFELPGQADRNEYDIMRAFTEDLDNPVAAEDLSIALRGRGASRRFKDGVVRWGVEDRWYAFKGAEYRRIARAWCEENEISFREN